LLQRANKLLYDAKDCGKNAIVGEAYIIGERKENFNLDYNVNGGSI